MSPLVRTQRAPSRPLRPQASSNFPVFPLWTQAATRECYPPAARCARGLCASARSHLFEHGGNMHLLVFLFMSYALSKNTF